MLNCHSQKQSGAASAITHRQIKLLLLLRVVVLTLLLGVISLLQISLPSILIVPIPHVLIFITAIYIFSIASAQLLKFTVRYRLFALGQIITDSILAGIIVYFSGGDHSIFTFLYFFPVISSGLLLFKAGGLFIATFNLLNYIVVLTARQLDFFNLPVSDWPRIIHHMPGIFPQMSIYGLSFYLVALLSSSLAQRQRSTEDALNTASKNFDRLTQLYKQIFADISSGIITVDSDNIITSYNPAAENITGYSASESIGRSINRLADFPLSDDAQKDRPVIKIRRKDEVKIPVGYSWARLNMPDGCDDCRVYTLQDLSKIRAMERKVKQSEKMAAIGEIAAGIAHEFRNPLAAISGAAQVLNQDNHTDPGNVNLLKIILRESSRLEGKIGDFLQFSKPAVPEKQWLSLENKVAETKDILRRGGKLPDLCHLETDIPENLQCWADPHQLRQILINLIHNAAQSMATVQTQPTEAQEGIVKIKGREVAAQISKSPKAVIRIEISDNGSGMDQKTIRQIFAPFFTTRESGTGLGLSIVQQLVEGHNGKIAVNSTPGSGTIFTIDLPLP